MDIPFVDLKAQYQGIKGQVLEAIATALDNMDLFLGSNVRALEEEFARYCGASFAIGVASGTDALHLALRGCGVGPGDEVITVSHTFVATAEAIVLAGARPVFVDIDPQTHTMDPSRIEAVVTPRTKAILPVHLYGHPAHMEPILDLARAYNLKVVEDACQAHGATYNGRKVGTLGDAAAFSFYVTKNLGSYGTGGMVATNNEEVASTVRLLRTHGMADGHTQVLIGVNSRLDEIQAAILRIKLRQLDQWNEGRRARASIYDRLIATKPVETPVERPGSRHVYHLYVIQADDRDTLREWLRSRGVATGVHYPIPVHLQPAFQSFGYARGSLPITEAKASRVLSLPVYPELTTEQVHYVAQCIEELYTSVVAEPQRVASL